MEKTLVYIKVLLERGAKIHAIDFELKEIQLEIAKGIYISNSKPEVLVEHFTLQRSPAVDEFIRSNAVACGSFKPKKRGVILVDIVDYSKGDSRTQSAYLTMFQNALNESFSSHKAYYSGKFIEQIIPTGDGCFIVLHESLNDRFFRIVFSILSAMSVHQNRVLKEFGKNYQSCEKINIRIGCALGETDFFIDMAGNRNCFGTGMNEAARIMDCGRKEAGISFPDRPDINSIFFGEGVYPQVEKIFDWIAGKSPGTRLNDLGSLKDKHGMERRVWWMEGMSRYVAIDLSAPDSFFEDNDAPA